MYCIYYLIAGAGFVKQIMRERLFQHMIWKVNYVTVFLPVLKQSSGYAVIRLNIWYTSICMHIYKFVSFSE